MTLFEGKSIEVQLLYPYMKIGESTYPLLVDPLKLTELGYTLDVEGEYFEIVFVKSSLFIQFKFHIDLSIAILLLL